MVFGTEVAMSIKEGRKAIGYDIEKKRLRLYAVAD